jgi:hypothetical protein
LTRILLVFLLALPVVASALAEADPGIPDYTLEVSFDIRASLIKGLVTIPVKEEQGLTLNKGNPGP